MNPQIVFDFDNTTDSSKWQIVDDNVMGGISSSQLTASANGHGIFSGDVSTKNNSGFSSLRYRLSDVVINRFEKFVIKIKGDGKKYQFRAKSETDNYFYYITPIKTNHDWQIIEIPVKDMYPSFRGYRLEQNNYSGTRLEEIGFLIGNKRDESFKLEIDWIRIE